MKRRAKRLEELGITRREAEVLFLLTQGKTNREIGMILGVSPKTIEKHLERIYDTLGVGNRIAAAMRAVRHMARKQRPR